MFSFNNHDCSDELRQFKLKATPARLAVMKYLEETKEPVDVSMVIDYLRRRDVDTDPATVFRIMKAFTDKGLTKQVQFLEGKKRYELAGKGDHHHLICTDCGKIEDVEDKVMSDLEKEIFQNKHFKVKSHVLEFFGICKNCQS